MSEVFEVYGSIISPTLAFILGLVAFSIKDMIQNKLVKRQTRANYNILVQMLSGLKMPPFEEGDYGACKTRRTELFSMLIRNIRSIQRYFGNKAADITRWGTLDMIQSCFYMDWCCEQILADIMNLQVQSIGRKDYDQIRDQINNVIAKVKQL